MLFAMNAVWASLIVDLIAVIVIIGFALIALKRGFVDCVFSLFTTLIAFLVAILLMRGILRWTNGLFGLQDVIENGLASALGKIKGMGTDVSAAGLEASLEGQNIPKFLANIVVKNVADQELAAGTTLAMLVAEPLARFTISILAFFVLFIGTKLLLRLLKRALSSFINKLPIVGKVNRLLGLAFGFVQGLLIISAVVALIGLIPSEGVQNFFANGLLIKLLYNHNPISYLIGWVMV